MSRLHVTFIDKDGEEHSFEVSNGDNLLAIAQDNDLEMEGNPPPSVIDHAPITNLPAQELAEDHAPAQPAMSLLKIATPMIKSPNPTMMKMIC